MAAEPTFQRRRSIEMIDKPANLGEAEDLILLRSKCSPPLVAPDVLAREHLFQKLDGWPSRRLTFVQGAPGYGKSMLAVSWLRSRWESFAALGADVAWVSLDEGDDDPRLFLAYIAASLATILPATTAVLEQNLRREQFDLQRLTNMLLNGISRDSRPLLLILDDYQHIEDKRVHQAIRRALEQGPANLHLLLLSRRDPPPALGSLGSVAGVLLLNTEDLRFREDEIGCYLGRVLGLDRVPDNELSILAARSRGWVIGLKLAALGLPPDADVGTLAALLHGQNQWLSRYFVAEFLQNQPQPLQEFLLNTSILEWLAAPLCVAVTGWPDAGTLLQQAVSAGLFLGPAASTEGRFFYHDLIRELLQAELKRRCSKEYRTRLHQRAAVWLEANGDIGTALGQYLAAGLADEATELVERHCLQTMLRGHNGRARRWLALLQKQQIELSARLIADQVWLYILVDRGDTLQLLQATQAAWDRQVGRDADIEDLQTERMLQLACAQYLTGNFRQAITLAEQLNNIVSPRSHFLVRGFLHFLYLVHPMTQPERAKENGFQALAIFEANGWISGAISVSRALSLVARKEGDVQPALDLGRRAMQLAKIDKQDQTLEAIYNHRQLADIHYNLNQIDEARKEIRTLVVKAEVLGETHWVKLGTLFLGLCDLAGGNNQIHSIAKESLNDSALFLEMSAPFQTIFLKLAIRYWIAARAPDNAWRYTQHLPFRLGDSPRSCRPLTLIGYLNGYLAQGTDLEAVEPVLSELEQMVQEMPYRERQLQVCVLQSWYWLKRDDELAAQSHLVRALDIIMQTGYVRYLLDVPDLRPLLATLEHPALQRFPELDLVEHGQQPAIDLTNQELAILHLLAERHANSEIAELLFITEGTVKWHLHNIYHKLNVKNRRAAVARAQALGISS